MGHYREPIKPAQNPVAPGLAKGLRYFLRKFGNTCAQGKYRCILAGSARNSGLTKRYFSGEQRNRRFFQASLKHSEIRCILAGFAKCSRYKPAAASKDSEIKNIFENS